MGRNESEAVMKAKSELFLALEATLLFLTKSYQNERFRLAKWFRRVRVQRRVRDIYEPSFVSDPQMFEIYHRNTVFHR